MTIKLRDYRAFGYQKSPAPINIFEGNTPTVVLSVNLTNQPLGTYQFGAEVIWELESAGKYMEFGLRKQGILTPVVRHIGNGSTVPSLLDTFGIIEVTDGTLALELLVTYPTQSGVANGVIHEASASWERKLEA